MLRAIDLDGNHTIEEDEFVRMIQDKMHLRDSPEEIRKGYDLFCKYGDGDVDRGITYQVMYNLRERLNEHVDERDLEDFIRIAKADCDERRDQGGSIMDSGDPDALNIAEWTYIMGKCKGK